MCLEILATAAGTGLLTNGVMGGGGSSARRYFGSDYVPFDAKPPAAAAPSAPQTNWLTLPGQGPPQAPPPRPSNAGQPARYGPFL